MYSTAKLYNTLQFLPLFALHLVARYNTHMTLQLYNTPRRTLEPFTPQDPQRVTLYTCGPTVYDHLHVGNWAAYIYWDILVRTLLAHGYRVKRVMNITDVGHLVSDGDEGEDKLEKGARREGKSAWDVAEFYTEDFIRGLETLHLTQPQHLARATDFIDQQLELVRGLMQKGYTYQTTDGIYFDTGRFSRYAEFARLDLSAQRAGARIEHNEEKRHASDFALWKFSPAETKRDMEWDTPSDLLGGGESVKGFPGWHLECSAMAMDLLGETLDIHTGGIDHIPVHHTNEIAQSEALSDKRFSNVWLHNNHLKVDGTKISKSLGNGHTLQQLKAKGFEPLDYKMFVLQGSYQNEGNFTFKNLAAAQQRRRNWLDRAALRHQIHDTLTAHTERSTAPYAARQAVVEALRDNLNTPEALRIIDEAFDELPLQDIDSIHRPALINFLEGIDELQGLELRASAPDISDEAKQRILERERAREDGHWERSDALRSTILADFNLHVRDTPRGTIWSYAH